MKPATASHRTARKGASRRGRALANGHIQRKGTKAGKPSKLNLKAAMGMIAAAASDLAHTAVEETRHAGQKVAAMLQKGQRSLSRIGAKAHDKFAGASGSSKRQRASRNPLQRVGPQGQAASGQDDNRPTETSVAA